MFEPLLHFRAYAAAAALIASGGVSICETVIEESFASDPKWETKGMDGSSSFGWNSGLKAIATPGTDPTDGKFVRRNGWDLYFKNLKTPITDKTSFTLGGDVLMSSEEPYSRIYLGLFDQDAPSAEERNAIYIERSRNPTQHYLKIYIVDESGEKRLESKFFGLRSESGSAQSVEANYDASNRTLTWTVDGKAVDAVILPADLHFSANACGVSNARWSNASKSYTATGRVDNVHLQISSP